MEIAALQKFSLIDFPGKICAVLFTRRCNFRCPYCHNPELVLPELFGDLVPVPDVLSFLDRRRNKLDALSVTGGEPTLQGDIVDFIKEIKSMGYIIKIDTNGSRPAVIAELIDKGLIDFLSMDVKAPLAKYESVARVKVTKADIRKSIETVMASGIDYEFRTTVVRSLLTRRDLLSIGRLVSGARRLVLQKFIPSKTVDPSFMHEESLSSDELQVIGKKLEHWVEQVHIR
ncbi:MAG: anaerobic ribonucleoside-triphosphate reductase activating protein [Deltaproteobacteria bacterium]|nr:anaerobic ribonucleoside-triphosphate reductase activating protein [Deltaproteobacteria bacterium]